MGDIAEAADADPTRRGSGGRPGVQSRLGREALAGGREMAAAGDAARLRTSTLPKPPKLTTCRRRSVPGGRAQEAEPWPPLSKPRRAPRLLATRRTRLDTHGQRPLPAGRSRHRRPRIELGRSTPW